MSGTRPIGWRAANRILNGDDGGPGTEDLHEFIAIASAPAHAAMSQSSEAAGVAHAEAEPAGREAMLATFREYAAVPQPAGRKAARKAVRGQQSTRRRRASGALVLRFTTAVLLVCGVGAAAATAGVLPAGVQRIAHDYFGIGRASTPSTHVSSAGTGTSGPPRGSSTGNAANPATANSTMPANSLVMVALCQQVAKDPSNWQADLSVADQATLIAAAGKEQKVKGFCTRLLADVSKGATPSPDATDTPTPMPSVTPTETHGNAHVSHSPGPHSTVH